MLQRCRSDFGVEILPIEAKDKYFLESRLAAVKALPKSIKYVFPIQEDFLLQARPDEKAIQEAIEIFDTDPAVASIRLMPCPGPGNDCVVYKDSWYRKLNIDNSYGVQKRNDEGILFTFQATLWRREEYCLFLSAILDIPEDIILSNQPMANRPEFQSLDKRKKFIQVDINIAENFLGQSKFKEILGKYLHLAYPRAHPKPNAVYLCPWPYRPTAVERGQVGKWVYEFAEREGFPLLQ
jgi:hypothetical protein